MTWRERRAYSYLIHEFDDRNLPYSYKYINDDILIKDIIEFFNTESRLEYPAKSYFVAIVYATLFEKYFNVNFYDALSEDDLLIDDPYFVSYSRDKYIYDSVLKEINYKDTENMPSTKKTSDYFKEEFLIGVNC